MHSFEINLNGTRPLDEAIITCGGVSVKEINPSTMGSKLVSGLYFAGEIIDVDAYTGGYNLTIAFSTGRLAGKAHHSASDVNTRTSSRASSCVLLSPMLMRTPPSLPRKR